MSREETIACRAGRLYDLTMRLRERVPLGPQADPGDHHRLHAGGDARAGRRHPRAGGARRRRRVCGELGDLLFQVYFMASVAEEQGLYDLGDVAAGIHAKLVRRHPHIFGDGQAETPEDVKKTWDVIKRDAEGREGIFHDVPSSFPATLLAQKLQQRAAAVGFDWEQAADVMAKVEEETAEIGGGDDRRAIRSVWPTRWAICCSRW